MITDNENVKPADTDELAALIDAANRSDATFIPRGGGTALEIGNAGSPDARYLDLSGISGVISYQPADLTLSVSAGTRLSDVQQTLAEHGQELPIDIPLPESATVGGLVATGFAGPRRLGSGTLKDLMLGCSYVRGDGLIAKAGGSVVKNVSGFEIPRLLHGSWGALAVLTSVNFKVTPKLKAELTIAVQGEDLESSCDTAHSIRTMFPSLTSLEIDHWETGCTLLLRLMGRSGALAVQASELVMKFGGAVTAEQGESSRYWQSRIDDYAMGHDLVQLVLSTRSRFIGESTSVTLKRLGLDRQRVETVVSAGSGVSRIRFPPELLDATQTWNLLDVTTLPGDARAIVEFAPGRWKEGIDVWGSRPDGQQTMKAIKDEFDPRSVLNPGRLFI